MITLNRLAERCREIALNRHIITIHSSHKGLARSMSAQWRKLWDAPDRKSDKMPRWTYREEKAAEIIVSAITYLKSIGCEDIEQLIKDKIECEDRED